MLSEHEADAVAVDEMRALAAYGLGDQRLLALGVRAEEQDGRVELDELQVGDLRPGPQRERHPVAGGDGGLVVAEKTWPMPPVARTTEGARTAPTPSCWPSPMTCSETPAVRPSASVSRSRTRAFSMVCRAASRTAPTRAREISAPVASPPAWAMRRRWWPPSRVSAMSPLSVVSKCAPVSISRAYGVGALGDQGAHGLLVAEARTRDEGVVEVLLGGVALAERGGDAALGPAGRAVVEAGLGDDDGVQAGRRRSAGPW